MSKGWQCRTYYNPNPFIGLCLHDTVGPIPAPPFIGPTKLVHIDFSVVQGLWLGCFLSTGRDKSIVSDDLLFVGRMSDAGFGVPHISIPPTWFNVLTSLFAMSNSLFGASGVQIACKNLLWGNEDCDIAVTPFGPVPFSINLGCFDPISLPTDLVVVWGSVYAGVTWADIAAAAVDFAVSIAMDVVSHFGGKFLSWGWGKTGGKVWAKMTKKIGSSGLSTGVEKYAQKALYLKGAKDALGMTDDDLAKYISKKTGKQGVDKGYSKSFKEAATHLDEGLRTASKEQKKDLKSIFKSSYEDGFVDVATDRQFGLSKNLTELQADWIAKVNVLENALRELDTVVVKKATSTVYKDVAKKVAKKVITKGIYKQLIKYGNVLGSGTSGGAFSTGGLGITDFFQTTREWNKKYGSGDDAYFDLGIEDADETWENAYVETGDADYWFGDDNSVQDDTVGGDITYNFEPEATTTTTNP